MSAWIMRVMDSVGYLGVFLLITLENVFPPIPSEVILAFGGFMTTYTRLQPIFVILCATAGSLAGAVILYGLGRWLGLKRILKLTDKYGRYIRLKTEQVERAEARFHKSENKAVFFCRMIPVLRSLISIPAGISKMNFTSFILLTAIGSMLWNIALVMAGALLGENWESALKFLDAYKLTATVLLAAFVVGFLIFKIIKKRKKAQMQGK